MAQGMSGKRSYHTPRDPAVLRTMPQAGPTLTASQLRQAVGNSPSRKGAGAKYRTNTLRLLPSPLQSRPARVGAAAHSQSFMHNQWV